MSLLVEYTIKGGMADEQISELKKFTTALRSLGDSTFDYTAYETDDPTKFIAVLDFDDEDAKQRFLRSDAFAAYRDGTKGRFVAPPNTTALKICGIDTRLTTRQCYSNVLSDHARVFRSFDGNTHQQAGLIEDNRVNRVLDGVVVNPGSA